MTDQLKLSDNELSALGRMVRVVRGHWPNHPMLDDAQRALEKLVAVRRQETAADDRAARLRWHLAGCPDNQQEQPMDDRNGEWATVTLNEASVGRGWHVSRTVGITRWATRERALERAQNWASAQRRAAVIPWGEDLENGLGASPENANIARAIEALALATHEPQFEVDGEGPQAMPTGRVVGCSCGHPVGPTDWKVDGEHQYALHIAQVFPSPS